MTAPVEARHQEAVEILCLLVAGYAQNRGPGPDIFGQGMLAAVGVLALDAQPGSFVNTQALIDHGIAVVDEWATRQPGQAGVS